jgi:predicted MFS family arabinose efflux permease
VTLVMGRSLVIVGLVIAAIGVVMMLGVPLGRLPGDFTVRRGSFTFYFPLATSIVVSILLTLLLQWLRR